MNARLVAITTILLLVISGCGYNPARDKDCPGCDFSGANLTGAFLTDADLSGANLDGVIGADFTGAENVPSKYR